MRSINRIALLLLWLSCCSLSTNVHQAPSSVLGRPHGSATISCNHSVSSYNVILWYQQPIGDSQLKLIGYLLYTSVTLEDSFKQHFNVTGDGSVKSQLHVLKLRQTEDSGVYYCAASMGAANYEAYFGQGTKLTVLEKDSNIHAPDVKVFEPSKKECRNKKKTLVCMASNFFPDHVSIFWKIDGENRTDGVATDNTALKQHKDDKIRYTITSRLRVDAEDWFTPGKNFTCIVSFFKNETTTEEKSDSVVGVEAPAGRTITRENYLRVTNAAKLSYGVFIAKSCIYGVFVAFLVWKLQGSTGKQNK